MGASNSKGEMAKNGGEWTSRIYFNPRADNKKEESRQYELNNEDLKTTIQRLIDNERIIKVFVYKVSLFGWQLSNLLMYHAFVVILTNKWWWSVEKNTEGITIQRSKEKTFVQDFYRENKRPSSCTLLEEERGYGYLMGIFEWFYNTRQLHQEYNLYYSNCKDFANALFQKIAFSKNIFILSMIKKGY